ncbi:MAG TPA: GAF domain-containing protein [Gaiellaceae bacterium]|jgi:GAF domain-containing protein|nr:GAF domain-containing protein [Gaiellaceae bacterium]
MPSPVDRLEQALEEVRSATTLPGLLSTTCRELISVVDAQASAISRVVGEVLIQVAEKALDERTLALGHGFLIPDFPLTRTVLDEGTPHTVSVLDPDPEPNEAGLLRQLELDSLLMLPLVCDAECWGLAEIYVNGRRFTDEDVSVAAPLAEAFGDRLASLPAPTSAR